MLFVVSTMLLEAAVSAGRLFIVAEADLVLILRECVDCVALRRNGAETISSSVVSSSVDSESDDSESDDSCSAPLHKVAA